MSRMWVGVAFAAMASGALLGCQAEEDAPSGSGGSGGEAWPSCERGEVVVVGQIGGRGFEDRQPIPDHANPPRIQPPAADDSGVVNVPLEDGGEVELTVLADGTASGFYRSSMVRRELGPGGMVLGICEDPGRASEVVFDSERIFFRLREFHRPDLDGSDFCAAPRVEGELRGCIGLAPP